MHVAPDLNWFLQFVVLAFAGAFGLLYLVRNTASRYFMVDSNFDSPTAAEYSSLDRCKIDSNAGGGAGAAKNSDSCAVCGLLTKKQCARCKMVKYCSEACQRSHWNSEHKTKCKDLQSFYKVNRMKTISTPRGSSKVYKQSNKMLFPYEEFVEYFKWEKPGHPPCGLLNCGNSCFANVVLQCLSYTRPLVSYLLEEGHRRECQRDDWCFLCEFQTHVERTSQSAQPFSPMNILSRLPNIGGNLGYGKQEDAHEFMRFSIDTMQSVCLDEFGGEKEVHPSYQTTTLIQHIFGGRLRSQVICAECKNISNQFENMMDLTVEIHGDAGSLEECLDQFTAKESLDGDNMYKCDGCNAYVMAWKRLTIQQAPNILTIALKRFQSGRFGKLNKRVTFPEKLDLSPYMSESEDGNVYKLYAVIVHVDMLNASFFGHYICYVKDFRGNWYRIDDCKVAGVDLDEVLSQGAYMLLYSRIGPRPSCLLSTELLKKEEGEIVKTDEVDSSLKQYARCLPAAPCNDSLVDFEQHLSTARPGFIISCEEDMSVSTDSEDTREDVRMVLSDQDIPIVKNLVLQHRGELPYTTEKVASHTYGDIRPNSGQTSMIRNTFTQFDTQESDSSASISDSENAIRGSEMDVSASSLRKSTIESSVAENCFIKEGSITCDISDMDTALTDAQDEVNSGNSLSILSNVEHGNGNGYGYSSSDGIENGGKKTGRGRSSSVQYKPLLSPGFLGKNLEKECVLPENFAPAKHIQLTRGCHLNNHRDEVERSSSYGNSSLTKNDGMLQTILENGKSFTKL